MSLVLVDSKMLIIITFTRKNIQIYVDPKPQVFKKVSVKAIVDPFDLFISWVAAIVSFGLSPARFENSVWKQDLFQCPGF